MGGGDAPGRLAAAVSNAGGLGLIGGTTIGGAEWLADQIRIARALTDRPFGVGFISQLPGAAELMAVALDEGVRVIAHSFADPHRSSRPRTGPARSSCVRSAPSTPRNARRAPASTS
jgi:nitronate monooxygenase